MARTQNPSAGTVIGTGLLIGAGVWGIRKLRGRKRARKQAPSAPKLTNYSEIIEPSILSFATADRQYKYEEGLLVRPAVLMAGPSKDYVRAQAKLHADLDFIWTTKQTIAATTAAGKATPLPVTIIWAFPIANILAGQWVKSSGAGSTAKNEREIEAAIALAKTGDVATPPGVTEEPPTSSLPVPPLPPPS